MRSRLGLARLLSHFMVSAGRALVFFGFASLSSSLVPVFSSTARPLSMMFSYVPGFVFRFSRSRCIAKSLCAALAVLLALVE